MKLTQRRDAARRHLFGAIIGVLGIVGAQRQQVWADDIARGEKVCHPTIATAGNMPPERQIIGAPAPGQKP